MNILFEIKETNDKIKEMVIREMCLVLNKKAKKAVSKINSDLRKLIQKQLKNTDIYKELTSGSLKAEFGFPKGSEKNIALGIINIISQEVFVDFEQFTTDGLNIDGGYNIAMIFSDFKTAIDSDLGHTDNDGERLPWLEWLLIEGDKIIITGHKILFKNTTHGRSKKALMIKGGINKPFWRVPPQFSGVVNNNWITRAFKTGTDVIDSLKDEIENIVFTNMERVI